MSIRIVSSDIHLINLRTRMPFKYGIATMTSSPHALVRVRIEAEGRAAAGVAADHLPPKWFTKNPDESIDDEILDMLRVIEHAVETCRGLSRETPFDIWRQLDAAQTHWGQTRHIPPLLCKFGTTLVERALIEAVCRATGETFPQALKANSLGIRLGDIHPPLTGRSPDNLLPAEPRRQIIARHTIGMADPLVASEIPEVERLSDGLPQSLDQCIATYGLRHFKVKVRGEIEADLDRLRRIARVIAAHATPEFAFTLDGNEQFKRLADFQVWWERITADSELRSFFSRLLFVEQPLHRDVALDPQAAGGIDDWSACPKLIIDESDAELDSLPRAVQLGYAGTSHKNCKGVFHGIANACLLAELRNRRPERQYVMSGEDLANIGPVALLQDLTVAACLGVESVERNGHHYFRGLSQFPKVVQEQVAAAHGDLYHPSPQGWPTLTIRDGRVRIDSLLSAPLGVGFELNVEQFTPVEQWKREFRNDRKT
ncbi:MAG: hypothetical protein HY000_02050 [Planctomycetes bacterium]|nr:hypothetical protein [Planctomycetota bacterium]